MRSGMSLRSSSCPACASEENASLKISVVVCTWNGERWIEEQIRSILDQDRPVDEVLVFDDRSTDSTVALVDKLAIDSRVPIRVHVNRDNLGSTLNFQEAIRACSGNVVFLSDQDDRWMSNKVSRFVELFESRPNLRWIFSDAGLMDEDGRPTEGSLWRKSGVTNRVIRDLRKDALGTLLRRPAVTGATMACRREDLLRCLPIPAGWVHDYWITLHLAARAIPGVPLTERLIEYRVHSRQQIGVKTTGVRKLAAKSYGAGGDDYLREAEKFESLADSLARSDAPLDGIGSVRGKVLHLRARAMIHQLGPCRGAGVVLKELMGGRYRFSWSKFSFLMDLIRIAKNAKARSSH